jgi:hypothetical protein
MSEGAPQERDFRCKRVTTVRRVWVWRVRPDSRAGT